MAAREFTIRALGEIAIRCRNKDAMVEFYHNLIGLPKLPGGDSDRVTFLRIAEGHEGHISVLALFRHDIETMGVREVSSEPPRTGATSSLHHIALSLPFAEQQAVMDWYEQNAQPYRVEIFDWIGWRGIFTEDPDGNTVELVASDPSWNAPG